MGYVYKLWQIQQASEENGNKDLKICIRCAVHTHTGKMKNDGGKQFMNVYAFNEHSSERSDWRGSIDNSIIPCFNKEITDNSFKVSRWLIQALLADTDLVKFAFISRDNMSDNKRHVVMGTHTVQTQNWAQQMNVSMDRMWNILKFIANEILDASKTFNEKKELAKINNAADKNLDPKTGDDEEDEEDGDETEFILLKDFNAMQIKLYIKDEANDLDNSDDQIKTD